MTDTQRRAAAKQFAADWQGKGYEKGHSQTFWLSLLQKVYGVEEPDKFITFEDQIMLDHTSFIDGFIPSTHVLIEQKSLGKELNKPIKQSDGSLLSPFQQAKRYAAELPYSQRPRWIVTCNFAEFHVYDMERPTGDPEIIKLCDLEKEYYRLQFLVDTGDTNIKKEMEVSLQAGEIVGVLYDALLKQYKDPETEDTLKSLNALCVRLVFCLYAEDAGIFGSKSMFHDYLRDIPASGIRKALVELFRILDQKPEQRDKYLADDDPALAAFPYVNGGLFSDENIEIPPFTEELKEILLEKASEDFNWSAISPTIFGAVFESTLNPNTRRSGGMHYTSIENIHKVIDPLFLDDLRSELEEIKEIAVDKTRKAKLSAFQSKLAGLTFLDPACGSGNFLTETYLSLRKLENEVLRCSTDQISMDMEGIIQVSIGQFYGIEINDFAVTVAKTALWIAESQMMKETEDVVHMPLDFLPLKSYANIVEGNALRLDWESVVPKDQLNYIMGNPPFVGQTFRNKEQAEEIKAVFANNSKAGKLDYVAAWYKLAATYMQGTQINAAFVSTNSISQGEQVAILWRDLFEKCNIEIVFAHRSFVWTSEAAEKAAVHCVIVGFSCYPGQAKFLFENNRRKRVSHINGYLVEGNDVFIKARGTPNDATMPKMTQGSKPVDGGNLIYSEEEYQHFLHKYPTKKHLLKRFMGSADFINNKIRFCLWIRGVSPSEYRSIPEIMQRLEACANFYEGEDDLINTLQFEVRDNTIHVLNYPDADMILGLPDSQYVKRLKDMWLHWWDLNEAKQSLESMNSNNSDVVNRALAQNSIVVFYKCFGKSEFRDNSLKRNKILANFPPEAKKVFDFYKDLRDKFIVHDESRLSQALAGVILQSNKEHPFVDTLGTVAIAERFKSPEELKGLGSFHRLITVAIQWVETEIDKLGDLLKEQFQQEFPLLPRLNRLLHLPVQLWREQTTCWQNCG